MRTVIVSSKMGGKSTRRFELTSICGLHFFRQENLTVIREK